MSAPKHTPGLCIFRAEIEDEELVVTPIDGPPVRIHLLRVLACVNACAGLSTEALEAGELAVLLKALTAPVASPDASRGMAALARLTGSTKMESK